MLQSYFEIPHLYMIINFLIFIENISVVLKRTNDNDFETHIK